VDLKIGDETCCHCPSVMHHAVVLLLCVCCREFHLSASNAVVNATETGVYAAEPLFQLSTNAWWTSGLSNSSATTVLRVGAAVSVQSARDGWTSEQTWYLTLLLVCGILSQYCTFAESFNACSNKCR